MDFPYLTERVAEVRANINAAIGRGGHGQAVRIVAVTKTHGPEAVSAAVAAGLHDVGENKVQEAVAKQDALAVVMAGSSDATGHAGGRQLSEAPGATWHLIGHLQRNKVKYLDRFALFHAVDSSRLADAIDEFGRKRGRPVDVLLEVNVSGEATKGGFGPDELKREVERLAADAASNGRSNGTGTAGQPTESADAGNGGMSGIRIVGVMTMAPLDAAETTLRRVFAGARSACEVCRAAGLPAIELSMGMSGDYEVAVEEGATMVRLGTVLFGERTP